MHLIDRVDDGKSPDGPLNPEVIAIQFYVEISPVVHDVEAQHASLSCKLGCRDPELVTGRPQVNQCFEQVLAHSVKESSCVPSRNSGFGLRVVPS